MELPTPRSFRDTLTALPPVWADDPVPRVRAALRSGGEKVVVLDDDPTGTQTVHDVPVLTRWAPDTLAAELRCPESAMYILTNSRALPPDDARRLNAEIGENLTAASQRAHRRLAVVSRSDSTLRGHFPAEVEALAASLGGAFDAWLVIPFFLEGARYTVGDVHYVREGDLLVPAGRTEFARDASFGYSASNLRQWVEEKSGGAIPAASVASISLEDVRAGGPERVCGRLLELRGGRVCIVNAAAMRDLEVFVQGLLEAEARGRRFLYRSAASFVQARAAISNRNLLAAGEVVSFGNGGGLVVVGSHVPRSSAQVAHALEHTAVIPVEADVSALLAPEWHEPEVARVAAAASQALAASRDTMVLTSRKLIASVEAAGSLAIAQAVSRSLVEIVGRIQARPRYLVAKGGITASDIATAALGVRRAWVLGQILPGIPVWRLGPETPYPDLSYIVFPGNVGATDALTSIITSLHAGG